MKIIIIIKWVSHYRLPFYESLKKELGAKDIELFLLYGEPIQAFDRKKKDWVDVPWGVKVPNIGVGKSLIWQPVLPYLKGADLIIVEQANKLLLNYTLQFGRPFMKAKLAFWGHGKNYQSKPTMLSSLKEIWKSLMLKHVDWWFTYTEGCARDIASKGFPQEKITSIENSVDTKELKALADSVSLEQIEVFKKKSNVFGESVAVYCGGMFHEKRLPFLLDSAVSIKKEVPDFELIVIGAGVDQGIVVEASDKHSWIHYLGPLFGKDKVLAMKAAKIYMMPGLVGLGVLDAFALSLPVVTTKYELHSPEIDYVQHKVNGLLTDNTLEAYVSAIVSLLDDTGKLKKLEQGCKISAERLSVENMAKHFASGIEKCLHE